VQQEKSFVTSRQMPGHVLKIGPCTMRGTVHLRGNCIRIEQIVTLTTDVLTTLVALPNLHGTSTLCEEKSRVNIFKINQGRTLGDLPVMQ
jgi:hypothetical protein